MDRDDSTVGDRYGDRLEDDTNPDNYDSEFPSMGVTSSVKKEWTLSSVYLPDALNKSLDDAYRDLRYESNDQLLKGRHYYPAVIALGLERVEQMDSEELKEFLEGMEV